MKGIIINWAGTLASIPDDWLLCNGNNSTPNLLGKYLLSVGASEDPGTTGGASTHTHTSPEHNHTQDGHTHSGQTGTCSQFVGKGNNSTCAKATHSHTYTTDSTTPSNTVTTVTVEAASNEPTYYKIAPILDSSVAGVQYPAGSLLFWNLTTLPVGWSLCDGNNGTPDLRNKFLKCVDSAENPGATGGASTHTHTTTAHNHTQNGHSHTGTTSGPSETTYGFGGGGFPSNTHTHSFTSDATTATNQTATPDMDTINGEPTFKKLLIIKNTGVANRPKYSICIWTGTIANIPLGYVLCNGSNGTPDLRDYFIKGALDSSELLNTGGSSVHAHTANSHNHAQDSHTHPLAALAHSSQATVWQSSQYYTATPANSSHAASTIPAATGTNQATTITISNCSSQANYPPYYKVAYIMQDRDLDLTGANLMQMLL
jgi:hypothetical protein